MSPPAQWNAAEYAANSAVQLAWARELIARLPLRGDEHILDVGCGDGKITAELAQAVPRGSVTGVDASDAMIRFAREKFPGLTFLLMDARRIQFAKKFDLVFSNAALHWVDDHAAFLRGAAGALRPGGRLVVSCGGRGNGQDVVTVLHAELRLKRWREYFRGMPMPYFFYAPADYHHWLPQAGFRAAAVELTPKDAVYEGFPGFATWLRTAWLPYTQRVPATVREEFITAVTERYVTRHPPDPAGRVHVRLMRLELAAVKT